MAQRYDAIVIGTGQAGPPLAVRLGNAGRKTAIIERKLIGGTCVNTGCIPTKTLIASARAAHVARRAADFGVMLDGPVRIDMARVKARKDEVVRQSNANVAKWIRDAPNVTLFEGQARFEGPRSVRVGERLLEAPQIFINVGGRAVVHGVDGVADVPYLHQHRHDGRRLPARAPADRRRQLHRARIRADVPAIRQRGHRGRDGRAPDQRARTRRSPRRSRRFWKARASRFRLNAKCLGVARAADGVAMRVELRRGAAQRSRARICCSPSAACRTPTTSASTGPA